MIEALLLAHLGACAALAVTGRRLGRNALALAAVVPAVTAVWAATRLGADDAATAEIAWVPGLDLELAFRVGPVATLLTLLVSGIGALVFAYALGYFAAGTAGTGRFATSLLAFSTAMLGLVWSDSVWTLFIFWELTSVTSFLLVGHKTTDPTALAAARRALMITGGGGLALLAGLLVLADAAGTTRLSELTPVTGTGAAVAAALVMAGAATKSAQVPFHVWLPGAMAAPTPVSAYLHSATMVKAGVVLVAVVGPALAEVATWRAIGLTLGVASVLWGAIGALRHRDAKLILAWGTVSQLGLLITLLVTGTGKATLAGISLLTAHALFKAALFLVVGEIDIRTGTRDVAELGGLARTMPVTFAAALLAGMSMAGAPPLLGFAAKEAAVEAALGLDGLDAAVVGLAVIGGSVLTVAYTVRFLLLTFGPGPATVVAPGRRGLGEPAPLLALAGVIGFLALGRVDGWVGQAASSLDPDAASYHLHRWPGLTPGLATSMGILAVGTAVGVVVARRTSEAPEAVGARLTDALLDGALRTGRAVCRRIQHGSLPVYVATMAVTASVAVAPFLVDLDEALDALWSEPGDRLNAWDHPLQGLLALAIVAAAFATSRVTTRVSAGLALGAIGIGVSGLFVLHGAPDLVLTQLLVETVVVVGFVVGLGRLSPRFPEANAAWRRIRIVVALLGGVAVMVGLAVAAGSPVGEAPVEALVDAATGDGGGSNVVNVILTDLRALDTVGEVVVLVTAAIGILALARAGADDEAAGTDERAGASA